MIFRSVNLGKNKNNELQLLAPPSLSAVREIFRRALATGNLFWGENFKRKCKLRTDLPGFNSVDLVNVIRRCNIVGGPIYNPEFNGWQYELVDRIEGYKFVLVVCLDGTADYLTSPQITVIRGNFQKERLTGGEGDLIMRRAKEVMTTKKSFEASDGTPVRRCVDCGGVMLGGLEEYRYLECGLSSVTLRNVMVFRCSCGSVSPQIRAIEQLHLLIAVSLLQKEAILSGEEVRFLRKVAGLTQAELAEIMGVHKTTPTGWETEAEPIGKENDRVLRSCCFFGMMSQLHDTDNPVTAVRSLSSVIRALDIREVFKQIKEGHKSGPKCVQVESDPDAAGAPWFLLEQRHARETCM